jgi:uncharacterized protein YndB with AHSA1/START domain
MAATTKGTAVLTLPADDQIMITREFNAPAHLVFRAWTTPELIAKWWSGERGSVDSIEVDLRVGGTWRYVMTANEGFQVAFHGEFQEIVENERIVTTAIYEGAPDDVSTQTAIFAEHDGRTTLTLLDQHSSKATRDAVIASGMELGLQEALNHLEEVAVSLA